MSTARRRRMSTDAPRLKLRGDGSLATAAGDELLFWRKWHYDAHPNYSAQIGNAFLAEMLTLAILKGSGRKEFVSERWAATRQQNDTKPWFMTSPMEMFPVKITFSQELPPWESHTDMALLHRFCGAPAKSALRWLCALTLGEDLIADSFEQARAMWEEAAGKRPDTAGPGDAVIHFRCGDVLAGIRNGVYGIPELGWYAAQIPHDAKQVLILGNFNHHKSSKSHRKVDKRAADRCQLLRQELPKFITSKTGLPARVVENGSPLLDFIMLATAPVMVGSISTFSLAAAACNRYGRSVLPASALFWPCKGMYSGFSFKRTAFVPFVHGQQCNPELFPLLAKGKPPEPIVRALAQAEGSWEGFANLHPHCPREYFKAKAWRRANRIKGPAPK